MSEGEKYYITETDQAFGSEGRGVHTPSGELVFIVKGQERAELLVAMLEEQVGIEMLVEWTKTYEAELAKHDDHDRAIKAADEKSISIMLAAEAKRVADKVAQ